MIISDGGFAKAWFWRVKYTKVPSNQIENGGYWNKHAFYGDSHAKEKLNLEVITSAILKFQKPNNSGKKKIGEVDLKVDLIGNNEDKDEEELFCEKDPPENKQYKPLVIVKGKGELMKPNSSVRWAIPK